MKRYWLFAGNDFYPDGGLCDFHGSFDTLKEATDHLQDVVDHWWHVFDSQSHTIVDFKEGAYSGELEDVKLRTPELAIAYDEE